MFKDSFRFNWVNGIELNAVKHRTSSTECYYYRYYDPMEMHFVEKYLRKGDVFADVGANIGSWALFASSLGAKTVAIDPTPSMFKLIEDNIRLNPNIKNTLVPICCAVGKEEGTVKFRIDDDTRNCVIDPNDLEVCESIEVPVRTMDSMKELKDVSVMKMDVERYELSALKGAGKILSESLNVLIIETFASYPEVRKLLESFGFDEYIYDQINNTLNKCRGRREGSNNKLFIKDADLARVRLGITENPF